MARSPGRSGTKRPAGASERLAPGRIAIDADNAGRRLDAFARQLLTATPLGTLMKWIRRGAVRVNGRRAAPDTRLAAGDVVSVPGGLLREAGPPPPRASRGSAGLDVLYEDEHLLVLDKPAGLAVHGGTGHERDSLLSRVTAYLGAERAAPGRRPGVAQRLDREVSGVMVVGKRAPALRALARAATAGEIAKLYVALVLGDVRGDVGVIDDPLAVADEPRRDLPRTRPDPRGARALTRYRVQRRFHVATLLEVRIETGRQHQIRAHLSAAGHPLVGDQRYGAPRAADARLRLARPFLHAASVELRHPADQRPLRFAAPLPPDLAAVLDKLGRGR